MAIIAQTKTGVYRILSNTMFKVARNVIPVKFHPGGDTHSVRISISYNKLGFGF